MIVSWNWLKDYVRLDMSAEEFASRLMMAGLNHESTEAVGDDLAIDLEVTSNRPDCLGHIGIAREAAVLWKRELQLPKAQPQEEKTPAGEIVDVAIECDELCIRYSARVIRGMKIGPSPDWMARRLETLGIARVNNLVDVTNYVLMETGQPLHAFDLARLAGSRIIVRRAKKGEKFLAINHKEYELDESMCVIADARRPVAVGGVMGGADTEVTAGTIDVLLECAAFDPQSIRTTARALSLHSPSSYRFERGVDVANVDWVSRRAAELILETSGGTLCAGAVDRGSWTDSRAPVTLRLSQLPRILGITIEPPTVRNILAALGSEVVKADDNRVEVIPPTWRRDLTREIDLVEEVARIHGYDKIPEDVRVPMVSSGRRREDRVLADVRAILVAAGMDEAMTISAVEEPWSEAFSPWSDRAALVCATPVLRRADRLRRSIVPSLLGARRGNEALSNPNIDLFEIAHVYLPQPQGMPREERMLAIAGGGDYFALKGVLEAICQGIAPAAVLEIADTAQPLLAPPRCCELRLGGEVWGYLGEVSDAAREQFELRSPATVAEVRIAPLIEHAQLIRKLSEPSPYPAVSRDYNFVFDERIRWADVAAAVAQAGGELVESVVYQETYRDAKRLGQGKKSLVFGISLRSHQGTLTREEADEVCGRIEQRLRDGLGGELRT
ncbi:MAG: phenylalanine--tRNA ligase subunit beta [Pirellulales bacterium]